MQGSKNYRCKLVFSVEEKISSAIKETVTTSSVRWKPNSLSIEGSAALELRYLEA